MMPSTANQIVGLPKRSRTSREPRHWLLVLVLGGLVMLGPFTMDLYLPAFPQFQHDLSVTEGAVQLTLTATAIGMGVGQLLVGPMSDAFGRRRPLLIATALHVLSSIAVAVAPTVAVVSLARFGQVWAPPRAPWSPWRWSGTCSADTALCGCWPVSG